MILRRYGRCTMYGMNYSGGDNRTHGQIERAERIDAFEAGKVEGWGTLFSNSMIPLDCGHFMDNGEEVVEPAPRPALAGAAPIGYVPAVESVSDSCTSRAGASCAGSVPS